MSNSGIPIVEDIAEGIGDVVDFVEDAVNDVGDAISDVGEWLDDEIIQPVVDVTKDVLSNELVVTVASIAATATGNAWAVPLIQGASVAAQGGDLSDVLEASAKAYVASQIGAKVGSTVGSSVTSSTGSQVAGSIIGQGTGSAAVAAAMGGDPLQAFITGGAMASVPHIMGQSDYFSDISSKMQDGSASAGEIATYKAAQTLVTSAVTGKEVNEEMLAGVVASTYLGGELLKEMDPNQEFSEAESALVMDMVNSSMQAYITGGNINDAIMKDIVKYGSKELKTYLKNEIRPLLTGTNASYETLTQKAGEIEANTEQRMAALEKYRQFENEYETELALLTERQQQAQAARDAVANGTMTIADAEAIINNYNDEVAVFQARIDDYYNPNLESTADEYARYEEIFTDLTADYNSLMEDFQQEAGQLDEKLEPAYEKLKKSFVQGMDPNFNPEEYAQINDLSEDADPYEHWLTEGQYQQVPTNFDSAESLAEANRQVANIEKQRIYEEAIERAGILGKAAVDPDSAKKFFAELDDVYGDDISALRSITGDRVDSFTRVTGAQLQELPLVAENGIVVEIFFDDPDMVPENRIPSLATDKETGKPQWRDATEADEYSYEMWDPERGEYVTKTPDIPPPATFAEQFRKDPLSYMLSFANADPDMVEAIQRATGLDNYFFDVSKKAIEVAKATKNDAALRQATEVVLAEDPTIREDFSKVLNKDPDWYGPYNPSNEDVSNILEQYRQTPDSNYRQITDAYIDPRYIDEQEVRDIASQEGYTLTDEEVQNYVGQFEEAVKFPEYQTQFDVNATTFDEAKQFFEQEYGYTPTDEEVNQFVGNLIEADQKIDIGAYVDPRQVTEDEARDFFQNVYGYTPTDEEVNQFVAQVMEEEQKTAIGAYVDPRQVTLDEAREFLSASGYVPTDEEIAQFAAQVNEAEQRTAIEQYVDPRFVDIDEIKEVAAQQGYDITDEQAQALIGQFAEEEQLAKYGAQFDPLATTEEEVRDFFGRYRYDPTDEEVQQFIGSLEEEAQRRGIGSYVMPGLEDVYGQIGGIGEQVSGLEGTIGGIGEQVTGLESGLGDLGTQVGGLETGLGELEGQVGGLGGQLQSGLAGITGLMGAMGRGLQRQSNMNALRNMLMQSGDLSGQQVEVKQADPARIGYMYDIGGESIFATPQQEQLFVSPYANGGMIEDPNDALLRLLGGR